MGRFFVLVPFPVRQFLFCRQGEVEVEVKLGLVLRPMKGMIENSINDGFDTALADSPGDSKLA